MLISKAYAQAVDVVSETAVEVGSRFDAEGLPPAPTPMEAFMWNMGLVFVLVILFYILLIRPQQKRFREHSEMLEGLKKGDKVVTGGGLIGKVEKIEKDNPEVVIDLGNGLKVTAVRSTLQQAAAHYLKPSNDDKKKAAPKDSKGDNDSKGGAAKKKK